MCGIAGFINLKRRFGPDELAPLPRAWRVSLSHRGPDDRGVWIDAQAGVALGHTRLAIIDLSPAGAQPMISSCGRFVLSYNGEIYNAPELRAELEAAGRQFRGHSDTEVMVEGFAVWGVRPTIERLIGMFAFAAWDRSTHTLTLARDRLGIKPLYWGRANGSLVFASELKALKTLPDWQGEIDRDALSAFLRYGYVPTPMSIYRGINKLAPGTLLECGEERRGQANGVLVAVRGRRTRPGFAARCVGRGRSGNAGMSARRRRAPAHGRGRAAWHVSVRRHRFLDGRGSHAGKQLATHSHLLDRLPRAGL